jgi:hypothetical protein
VPINLENHRAAHDGTERGCTKINEEKGTSLQVDLKPGVRTSPGKVVVPTSTSNSVDASSDVSTGSSMKVGAGGKASHRLKIGEHQSVEPVVCSLEVDAMSCGSVQKKVVSTKVKPVDNTYVASSSTSARKKSESASMHAVSANLLATVVKSCTSTSIQHSDSAIRSIKKIGADGLSDQRRVFSSRDRRFAPKTAVRYCRPRYLGGSIIVSCIRY